MNPDPPISSKPEQALPQVTVQVLHWRGLDKTRECLDSILSIDYTNFRILLVDNGSDAADHKTIKQEYPSIEVLALDQNYGFAGGSNRGLKQAMDGGADFVWLINNDATVRPETLSGLMQVAISNASAGALGALVAEGPPDNEEQKDKERKERSEVGVGAINYYKAKTYLLPAGLERGLHPRFRPSLTGAGSARYHRCQWLSGSNLLLRSSSLQKIGLFDERYYLYFEDVDLCLRLNQAGFTCLLVPGSVVRHQGNASTQGGLSLWRAYYHSRNRLLFFMDNCPPAIRPVALVAILAHFFRHCISLPLKGRAGRAKLHAEWLGLSDYFGGKLGRAKCLDWCENIKL